MPTNGGIAKVSYLIDVPDRRFCLEYGEKSAIIRPYPAKRQAKAEVRNLRLGNLLRNVVLYKSIGGNNNDVEDVTTSHEVW